MTAQLESHGGMLLAEKHPSRPIRNEGSAYGVILRLATPTVLAMVTQGMVSEADAVFFAHLPAPQSSNAQAALLPSLILLWVFGGSLSAISVGTQALSARRFAERKPADAGAVLVNAAFFSCVAGLLSTALAYLVLPYLLGLVLHVPEVRAAANTYLRWRLVGITSTALTFALKAFFDGIGKTHVHLVASGVMNALNIGLSYWFILGGGGLSPMGMCGAGVSGTVSTFVGLGIMIAYVALPQHRVFRPFDGRRLARSTTWSILRISIPSAIATIVVMSGFALFVAIVSKLDEAVTMVKGLQATYEAVNGAATTVVVVVLKLTFTSCLAFGTSTATLVSQSLGERNPDRATHYGWASVRLGFLIFGLLGLCEGVLFTRPLLHLVTKSDAVAAAALVPLRMTALCSPLIAIGMILTQALFGAGNSRFVMTLELLLHVTCLVPLAWILGVTLNGGLVGIWLAAVVYVVLLAAGMTWKFASGDWKVIRL